MDEVSYKFIDYEYTRISEDEMLVNSKVFYEKINKRRTVREISSEEISINLIENLILAAGTAPSGANLQPWKFCVVLNKDLKDLIRKESEEIEKKAYEKIFSEQKLLDIEFTGNNWEKPFLSEAPALIVAFKEKYRISNNGEILPNYYPDESIGLALGFLFVAIHNAGLVTIPYTPYPSGFLRKLLNRPENESPIIILPIGYPKINSKVPNKSRKKLSEIMQIY